MRVDVQRAAENRWGEVIAEKSLYSVDAARNCTPGAYNNENTFAPGQPSVFATAYGGGPLEYAEVLSAWRANGIDDDLEVATDSKLPGSQEERVS